MALSKKKTSCKNGYWYNEKEKCILYYIDGEYIELKNLICLDYPDIKPVMVGTCIYGDFGTATEAVVKASGAKNYNLKIGIIHKLRRRQNRQTNR